LLLGLKMANRNNINRNMMPGNRPENRPRPPPLIIQPRNQNVVNQGRQEFDDYRNMMPENRPENRPRPPPLVIRPRNRNVVDQDVLLAPPGRPRNRNVVDQDVPPAPLGANNVPNPFDNMGGQV
jgi:hypothetical protein